MEAKEIGEVYVVYVYTDYRKEIGTRILKVFKEKAAALDFAQSLCERSKSKRDCGCVLEDDFAEDASKSGCVLEDDFAEDASKSGCVLEDDFTEDASKSGCVLEDDFAEDASKSEDEIEDIDESEYSIVKGLLFDKSLAIPQEDLHKYGVTLDGGYRCSFINRMFGPLRVGVDNVPFE